MRILRRATRALLATALTVASVAGCNDFLTGGELTNDPNRPTAATNRQLFVGVQSNLWATLASDPSRVVGLWVQQFEGALGQYLASYNYGVSEQTTNGFHSGIYAGGGLRDVRELQDNARTQGDTLFLGIAQVQEALLIGTAADLFGDIVYTQALTETPNPALDPQLAVYDSVQTLLNRAITNLRSPARGPTNLGPGPADLNYAGNRQRWERFAHTLKARFFLHLAERRGAAMYDSAYVHARQGIVDPDDDYKAVFSGASGEENFWYNFTINREGYAIGNPFFLELLERRNDPRREEYFDEDGFNLAGTFSGGEQRIDPGFPQPLVTAQENLLIWAEAAQRRGMDAEARTQLNAARAIAGLGPVAGAPTGRALLNEILTEKYIALFQSIEVWNDYKRTCTPNLAPVVSGQKIPARLLYDAAERQTNTSIPGAQEQPTRNANDPPNAVSDGTGERCLGQ